METQKREVTPSVRKLNQHFLTDEMVLDDIVLNSNIESDDIVLEIGPGKGDLTRKLAEVARKVIAVEYDKRLSQYLDKLMEQYPNVEIIYGDALKIKFPKIDRIVSNIPFNITEPLISRLFSERFRTATLLVGETYGKQVAKGHSVSRIGLLTRAYFKVDYVKDIPSTCFDPEPATNGSVIELYPLKKQNLEQNFREYIIRCIWDQRTRPLSDALPAAIFQYISANGGKNTTPNDFLKQIQRNYHHPLTIRVDKLTNPEFLDLYDSLRGINLKKAFGGYKPRGGAKNWRIDYAKYL
ncbi:MAG: methyltransferase domain-containing protein [Nanoarchaeota archaeon]|nr:methyltransferase domain-containing protein [Nanoarchaeota archaeon]